MNSFDVTIFESRR